jgi:translocation and assembly module TamB
MKISVVHRIIRKGAWYGALFISVSVLVCILLFAMIQTDYIKGVSVNLINRYILSEQSIRLEAGKIKGLLPFNFVISELGIHDKEGRWIYLSGCSVQILPAKLLTGRLYIKRINVARAAVERLPLRDKVDGKEMQVGFSIPSFPSWLTIEDIQSPHIDLDKGILGEPAQYSLNGGITDTALGEVTALNLNIAGTSGHAGSLVFYALINSRNREIEARLSARDPGMGLIYRLTGTGIDLSLEFEGKGNNADFNGRLNASSSDTGGISSDIRVELNKDYRFNISGGFRPADTILSGGNICISPSVDFSIDAELVPNKEILFNNFEIRTGEIISGYRGAFTPADLSVAGDFHLDIRDTKCLEHYMRGYIAYGLKAEGSLKGKLLRPDIDITYRIAELVNEEAKLHDISGSGEARFMDEINHAPQIALSGSGSIGEIMIGSGVKRYHDKKVSYGFDLINRAGRKLKAEKVKVESKYFTLLASGDMDFINDSLFLKGELGLHDLDTLSGYMNEKITGSGEIIFMLQRDNDIFTATADADINRFSYKGAGADRVSARISGGFRDNKGDGKISARVQRGEHSLNIMSDLAFSDRDILFEKINISGMESRINGDINYSRINHLLNGMISVSADDLSEITSVSGYEATGAASGEIVFSEEKENQKVEFRLSARDAGYKENLAEGIDITGYVLDMFGSPYFMLKTSLSEYKYKGVKLETVDMTASGRKEDARIFFKGKGYAPVGTLFEGEAAYADTGNKKEAGLTTLKASFGETHITLAEPLMVYYSNYEALVRGINIGVDTGKITGSLNYSTGEMHGDIHIERIPLSLLSLAGVNDLEGAMAGKITIMGMPKMPDISGSLDIRGVRIKEIKKSRIPPVDIGASFFVNSDSFSGELSLYGISGTTIKGMMRVPCSFSIYPFMFDTDDSAPLNGSIKGEFDLASVASLFDIHDQRVMGRLIADFDINGLYTSPLITGSATFSDGVYENIGMGININNVRADISADRGEIIAQNISADDGSKGKVTGSGQISFDTLRSFRYNLSLSLKEMNYTGHDMLNITAGGRAEISGTANEHSISGRLNIEKADIEIPEKLPYAITELEIREININDMQETEKVTVRAEKGRINYDVSLSSNGRIYIYGRGLESKWKGALNIKGAAEAPVFSGELTLVRGNYNFLSRPFMLTQGRVIFSGKSPPEPYFEVTGRAVNNNISAYVNLKGNMKSPVFTLYSEPALPQDEIMSRILFDREASQITPIQALQLAGAVNELMGRKSFDPLAYTRNLIGVDWLQVKQSEESPGESALSAGKYLGDRFYVEIEKGISAESGKFSIRWELSPSITVDTSVGENADTEMGINIKHDY